MNGDYVFKYDLDFNRKLAGPWHNVFRITAGSGNAGNRKDRQLAVFVHPSNRKLHTTITTSTSNNFVLNGPVVT